MAPPYVAFRDASADQLRQLFDYLTNPAQAPAGGGGYVLRTLCAYGNTINPYYAGAFVRSGVRVQALVSNITFADLESVELDFRSSGFYPRMITSPGSHVANWDYLTFDIVFETGPPATRLGGVIDLGLLSVYVGEVNADAFATKAGNRGMITHLDGFTFGDGMAFISVISDVNAYEGFFGGKYPLRPDAWQATHRIVVGDTSAAWESHLPHRSMRHGWVRPDVIVPLSQQASPVGLFTEFLSLWKGSVYTPWPEPLDPASFDGGVAAFAPLTARELDDLTNPDLNPSWPIHIGAKTCGDRTVYSLVTGPPGQIDPLPRTIRSYSAWDAKNEATKTKSFTLAHHDFDALSRAVGVSAKLRPNLEAARGRERFATELGEPRLFHPADVLDSDVTAVWQRDALLRAEAESLRGWDDVSEQSQLPPWRPVQRKGAPPQGIPTVAPPPPLYTVEKTAKAMRQEWSVDVHFKEALRQSGGRMMQVAICKDGRLVYAKSFTYAEEGYPPPSLAAKLCIGSCQKPLVTMALLRPLGAAAIDTPLVTALGIQPVASVNTPDLHTLTLGHLMTHRSGLNIEWDKIRRQLDPPHPDQYTLQAGDYSRYLELTTDSIFKATPPTTIPAYYNDGFDILGEALGAQVNGLGTTNFEEAFRVSYSTSIKVYTRPDLHIRQSNWQALVLDGDFHRQTRLPGWSDAGSISPDYLGTTNGFDAGSGEFVMSVIELARIVSRLSPEAKAGPLLDDAARSLIESDPYGGNGGLTFPRTSVKGEKPNSLDLVLWHNGEVPAGSGWIEHRRPMSGPGASWTGALLINMETDGFGARTPLFSEAISILRAMDEAGLLTTEDLFDAFP